MARTRQQILDSLGQNVDEPNLTDQELQDRLASYQELGGLHETQKAWDTEGLKNQIIREISPKIAGLGASDLGVSVAADYAAHELQNRGSFDPQKFAEFITDRSNGNIDKTHFEDLKGRAANYIPQAQSFYSNYYGDQPIVDNVTADISRVGDLVNGRQQKSSSEKNLSDFINTLPGELSRGRNDFFSSERDYLGSQFNQEIAPEIMQTLNARGILDSGDLPNELTRSASGLLSGVEQAQAQQQEQDDLFFANAAYQETLRKEIEAGRDITGQIATDRTQTRQQQEYGFQSAQADLKRQFDEEQFRRQQERALASQRALEARRASARSDATTSGLVSGIGGAVGAIGGAYFGGPVGATVGVQVGSTIGRGVTS